MKTVVILALATVFLCGCRTAKTVAVTSFRVIDAPASFVRRHIDPQDQTTTTTTTSVASSDNVTPGRPVDLAPARPLPESRRTTAQTRSGDRPTSAPRSSSSDVSPRSSAAPAARTTVNQPQFPTAKPVPGKAGYVFSPFDPSGGYVDVTGYPSGSKAKDPYSQKVFIVP